MQVLVIEVMEGGNKPEGGSLGVTYDSPNFYKKGNRQVY